MLHQKSGGGARGRRMEQRVRAAAASRFGKTAKEIRFTEGTWLVEIHHDQRFRRSGAGCAAETGDYGGGLRCMVAVPQGSSIHFEDV